jgi:hypothetical protein
MDPRWPAWPPVTHKDVLMIRSTVTRLMTLAGLSLAGVLPAAAEPTCPSTHTPGTKMVCELPRAPLPGGPQIGLKTAYFALPLNTTIDENELPTYSVVLKVEHLNDRPSAVWPRLVMVDESGKHVVNLGTVRTTVTKGLQEIRVDMRAQRFGQPAYLKLLVFPSNGNRDVVVHDAKVIQTIGHSR